jgi:hypothetical protein
MAFNPIAVRDQVTEKYLEIVLTVAQVQKKLKYDSGVINNILKSFFNKGLAVKEARGKNIQYCWSGR